MGVPPAPDVRAYGEDTARAVDGAVRALVDTGFARAISILEHNRVLLDRTAEQLLKAETLNTSEIDALKQEVVLEATLEAA
jgi:cell division protease FtsH